MNRVAWEFLDPVARCLVIITLWAGFGFLPFPAAAKSDGAKTAPRPSHGIAMHGDLKYGPGFTHFDYVNPTAPKGGKVKLAAIGTFDNLNPFILKGLSASGIGRLFDTLVTESADEPFSQYGLIAQSIEVPADRSWVIFNLRPEARFHDGSPVTADDVVFTFNILKTKGHPRYRFYYASVAKAEKLGRLRVRFAFAKGDNRELPLIIGQLPVLPKAYWQGRDFTKTTLKPPLGSGPYRISAVDPGRSITYERDKDYWGAKLAVNAGSNNFDIIRYDYYRDTTIALEAFKAGEYDFREENVSKNWATAYDIPAVRKGLIKKHMVNHRRPTGMQAFVFNTRRDIFSDPRVRRALAFAFDFEWTNKNLFYGAYTRTESYFSNSELASTGLPSGDELAILKRFRGRIPEEVFTQTYRAPASDGTGNVRDNLLAALEMLKTAGWVVQEGVLKNATTGVPMTYEILLVSPSFERVVGPFIRNLKRLGIIARIRTVDSSQYRNRLDKFDFDMIVMSWGQSLSPGNEQRNFWGSRSAATPGSFNFAGISDPVVDELVELLIAAPDRKALVMRTRALDRVLLWGHYLIPHWHVRGDRIAYWYKFGQPDVIPMRGFQFANWWVIAAKEKAVAADRTAVTAKAATGKTAAEPPASSDAPYYIAAATVAGAIILLVWLRRRKAQDT